MPLWLYLQFMCSSVSIDLKNKLQTSQNKLGRVLFRIPACTHLKPSHYDKLGRLKVNDGMKPIKSCLIHKIVNGETYWMVRFQAILGIILTGLGMHIHIPPEGALLILYQICLSLVRVERNYCTLQLSIGTV